MLNCLLFSPSVPLISFFAAIFFYIKYHVDKYNLIFVYFKVFESGGKIRKNVTNFMVFTLIFYLLINVSFFSIEFEKKEYFYGGILMTIVWVIIYFYTKKQLMNEFTLDNDLTKKVNVKSGEANAKHVFKTFKKAIKKLIEDLKKEYDFT